MIQFDCKVMIECVYIYNCECMIVSTCAHAYVGKYAHMYFAIMHICMDVVAMIDLPSSPSPSSTVPCLFTCLHLYRSIESLEPSGLFRPNGWQSPKLTPPSTPAVPTAVVTCKPRGVRINEAATILGLSSIQIS